MNEKPSSDRAQLGLEHTDRANADRDIVDRHLQRAWQAFAPPSNLRELVRGRLTSSSAATLGAVGMGMASNARPEGAWASLQASGKLGALVGAGLLGVGLLSGYLIRDSQEAPLPPRALASPITEVRLPVPPAAPAEPREQERLPPSGASKALRRDTAVATRARRTPERVAAPDTEPAAVTAQPGGELALLRRAERALRTDNAALALALIGELEEHYPSSSLLEERRAIELMAYCSAGATDAAARAQRFLREYPQSAYAGRIRDLCPATGIESLAPR
jgi:hypothetical protein